MNDTVAVIIATFGDRSWSETAQKAVASVTAQTRPADQIIQHHAADLYIARNQAAYRSRSKWLIFLDADDELDSRYIESMLQGTGDIRVPAVSWVKGVKDAGTTPHTIAATRLLNGNYIVIGAMIRRELFIRCGGFDDYPIYEDWTLWIKAAYFLRAEIHNCNAAVYRIHVRPNSRNSQGADLAKRYLREISDRYTPYAIERGQT